MASKKRTSTSCQPRAERSRPAGTPRGAPESRPKRSQRRARQHLVVGGGEEDGKSLKETSARPAQLSVSPTEQPPERQSSWNVEFIPACLFAKPPLRAHTFGPLSFYWLRVPTVTERVSLSQGLWQWLPRKETSTSCQPRAERSRPAGTPRGAPESRPKRSQRRARQHLVVPHPPEVGGSGGS